MWNSNRKRILGSPWWGLEGMSLFEFLNEKLLLKFLRLLVLVHVEVEGFPPRIPDLSGKCYRVEVVLRHWFLHIFGYSQKRKLSSIGRTPCKRSSNNMHRLTKYMMKEFSQVLIPVWLEERKTGRGHGVLEISIEVIGGKCSRGEISAGEISSILWKVNLLLLFVKNKNVATVSNSAEWKRLQVVTEHFTLPHLIPWDVPAVIHTQNWFMLKNFPTLCSQ